MLFTTSRTVGIRAVKTCPVAQNMRQFRSAQPSCRAEKLKPTPKHALSQACITGSVWPRDYFRCLALEQNVPA